MSASVTSQSEIHPLPAVPSPKKTRTWTHRKLSPRFKTQTWFSPARGLSYLRPPQTSEKLELLPKFIINAHLYFAGMVSYQKFWVYEQRHTFLKLMLILWSQPSDFFCTHLVMGESHTFADAASHHLPHRCISCSCVRERKPPLADPWAWSAVHFSSPSYVSVNSTPKMETWESCFLTATLQWAEKLREWDAHPGSASVTTTLLLSTRARGCVSEAASIQGWPWFCHLLFLQTHTWPQIPVFLLLSSLLFPFGSG